MWILVVHDGPDPLPHTPHISGSAEVAVDFICMVVLCQTDALGQTGSHHPPYCHISCSALGFHCCLVGVYDCEVINALVDVASHYSCLFIYNGEVPFGSHLFEYTSVCALEAIL